MKISSISIKCIVTPILSGKIHGQGNNKKYVFLQMRTDVGNACVEIYCGTYAFNLVEFIVAEFDTELRNRNVNIGHVRENFLHKPFISGSGVYETVKNAIYNAILLIDLSWLPNTFSNSQSRNYLSGGTVKTSIAEMHNEIDRVNQSGFHGYKIRLDFRDADSINDRKQLLNTSGVPFAIDMIVNTNFKQRRSFNCIELFDNLETNNFLWLEEPVFPYSPLEWAEVITPLKQQKLPVAIGESLNSALELYSVIAGGLFDIIQIDSSHNGNFLQLSELQDFAVSQSRIVAYHNWGSLVTLFMNAILDNLLSNTTYFEVPAYKTKFDLDLCDILGIPTDEITSLITSIDNVEGIREDIFELISQTKSGDYADFQWV